MREGYLTLQQAAALAGLGRNAAYNRVLSGKWPCVRGPRAVYWIPEAGLQEALRQEHDVATGGIPTAESVIRELGDIVGLIEQIPLREDESWGTAQKRLRALRTRAVQLAEYAQRAAIRRALAKGTEDATTPAADRAA
jgi:hypothetical protein